ncbi:hypothetical protein GCM10029964_064370 [Kibdelosporangium lantanae]
MSNPVAFSSADGVFIPPSGLPRIPALEFDEPEHSTWRAVLNGPLTPRAVRRPTCASARRGGKPAADDAAPAVRADDDTPGGRGRLPDVRIAGEVVERSLVGGKLSAVQKLPVTLTPTTT